MQQHVAWKFYWFGLKLYDFLGRGKGFAASRMLSAPDSNERLPTLSGHGKSGGVLYQDGQFDDSRLLIDMALTAASHGACLVNYVRADSLCKDESGNVNGVELTCEESGSTWTAKATVVINATGPWADDIRKMDDSGCQQMVTHSQGVHIVLPRKFFPGDTALIVPKTSDGRVLFLIPWHDHVVIGTTDTPIPAAIDEPTPQKQEIEFLLKTTDEYLNQTPTQADVLSVFTGIRPLVRDPKSKNTSKLSRDHEIIVSDSKLVTITGGKWTTVRKMGEEVIDRASQLAGKTGGSVTKSTAIHDGTSVSIDGAAAKLHSDLPYTDQDVVRSVRFEMARSLEDVLARRTRALFLNSTATIEIAPEVARLMAGELGESEAWQTDQVEKFLITANNFTLR